MMQVDESDDVQPLPTHDVEEGDSAASDDGHGGVSGQKVSRRRCYIAIAVILLAGAILGVVLGVTLGKKDGSTSAEEAANGSSNGGVGDASGGGVATEEDEQQQPQSAPSEPVVSEDEEIVLDLLNPDEAEPTTSATSSSGLQAVDDVITLTPLPDDDDPSFYIDVLTNDVASTQYANLLVNDILTPATYGECAISLDLTQVIYTPEEGSDFVGGDGCEYEVCDAEDSTMCAAAFVKITIANDDKVDEETAIDLLSLNEEGDEGGGAEVPMSLSEAIFPLQQLVSDEETDSVDKDAIVAIYGNTAVVGAANKDFENDNFHGVVLVFGRDSGTGEWIREARLAHPDGAAVEVNPFYGQSVGIYENTIVVGSHGDGDDVNGGWLSGSAHVYVKDNDEGWVYDVELLAPEREGGDYFGVSVAVHENTIVVGSGGDRGDFTGSAHVYVRGDDDVWTHQAELRAPDGTEGDWFGNCVDVHGDTIAVSAWKDDNDDHEESGSVHIFIREGDDWINQAKLTDDAGSGTMDWFGNQLALYGDTVVVGARGDDGADGKEDIGSAHVFVRDADVGMWTLEATLAAPDGAAGDMFGNAVDVYEDTIVVAARQDDDGGKDSGSVHVYVREADDDNEGAPKWMHRAKLLAYEGGEEAENHYFGYSAAVHDGTVLVGSMEGEAHLFSDYL